MKSKSYGFSNIKTMIPEIASGPDGFKLKIFSLQIDIQENTMTGYFCYVSLEAIFKMIGT